jgi:hypothetical protein
MHSLQKITEMMVVHLNRLALIREPLWTSGLKEGAAGVVITARINPQRRKARQTSQGQPPEKKITVRL